MNESTERDKILLATFGTLGDVHPFIAVAKALQAQGLAPVIATSVMHRHVVEGEGIAFHPMRPDETDISRALGIDLAEVVRRMVRDPHFILDEIYLRFLAETYEDVSAASRGASAIVAHSLLLGAHLAAAKAGVPWVRVALSPIHLQSAQAPSKTPPLPYVLTPCNAVGRGVNRVLREVLWQRLALKLRPVHAFRRELGLPPARVTYVDCGRANDADAVVGLYSSAFAAPQPDQPRNARIVGFPFYRSSRPGGQALSDDLAAFLKAGPPPIVFTLGSFAVESSGAFYERSLEAARRLGRRAVLLTGAREAPRLAALAGPGAHVCAYAPHGLLFPYADRVVHHGGMGTTAEALRSGKPQVVVPFFGDQPDHAARLARLGVAHTVKPKLYTVERVAALIGQVGADEFCRRAAALAERLAPEDGAAACAALVQGLLRDRAARAAA